MKSVKQNISRGLLISMLIIGLASVSLLDYEIARLLRSYVYDRMEHELDSIIVSVQKDADGNLTVNQEQLSAVYSRVGSGHYFSISLNEEVLHSRSLFDREINYPVMDVGSSLLDEMADENNEYLLTITRGYQKFDQSITIWIAEDIQSLQADRLWFGVFAMVSLVVMLVLMLVSQQFVVQRGFRPIITLSQSIGKLRSGERTHIKNVPIELAPLVDEINRLLDQILNRSLRVRNAIGNLAHELKRHLQHLSALASDMPTKNQDEFQRSILKIRNLLDREMKRASIIGLPSPGRHFIIQEDLPVLGEMLKRIYPEIEFELTSDNIDVIKIDRDDVLELMGNLLENAGKFAKSHVWLNIFSYSDEKLTIQVEDDGPGVNEADMKTLTERGVRFDEHHEGAGFGLSIVQDIVNSYGGCMALNHSSHGGLAVVINFPQN